jgi:hypothetical protein
MQGYKRFSTVRQMAGSVSVFVALALLLESGGLYQWAQRLDLGPVRSVAMPVTGALHRGLERVRLERFRHAEIVALARVGWSDDPEAIAEAHVEKPIAGGTVVETKPMVNGVFGPAPEVTTVVPEATVPKTPTLPLKPMAGDPPLMSSLPPIAAVGVDKTRTVALAGDSMMAVGLSSTILRELPNYKDLSVVKTFKSGTGLARPEVFNWQREYPAMLKNAKPEVVLVAIGANDGQGFVEDGVTYPFGTEAWQAIYQRRVQAFLEMLEEGGAKVVWIGLPPMKSGVYDARIALVNRIDYAVVSASPQAIWFSSAGLVGDASGRFQDFGQVRGATARLRQADGIHLSDDGAVLLTAKLLPWLAKQETAPIVVPVVPIVKDKETASVEVKN